MGTADMSSLDLSAETAISQLQAALRRHRYGANGVADALGVARHRVPLLDEPPAVLSRRLPDSHPLSGLVRLFLLMLEVDAHEATTALAPLPLADAQRVGLVNRTEDDRVRAAVRLVPVDDLVLACDHAREGEAYDHVMAPARSSLTLLNLTVDRPAGTVLDVGTGSGVQALVAAGAASRVVATDPNRRALGFTSFNCLLNEVEAVETREGAELDPVAGELFDLIVSNPPFVLSPDDDYRYRDGGGVRGDLSRNVVRQAARHLAERGVAQVLVHWIHADDAWDAPLRTWVDGLGCDAWLLRFSSTDGERYAERWNYRQHRDPAIYRATVERWLAHLRRAGAGNIGFGMVVLRRPPTGTPAGRVWSRTLPKAPGPGAGIQLRRIMDQTTRLAALNDEALLTMRLERAADLRVVRIGAFDDEGLDPSSVWLRTDGPLAARLQVTPDTATAVTRLDGSRTLRQAVGERGVRGPAGDVQPGSTAPVLADVRALVGLGLLRLGACSGSDPDAGAGG